VTEPTAVSSLSSSADSPAAMLVAESLGHEYLSGGQRLTVLKDITFRL